MTNVLFSGFFVFIALSLLSGNAQAGRLDELELTIRVMESDHQSASDLVNEIELPKETNHNATGQHDRDKDHRGDNKNGSEIGDDNHSGDRVEVNDDHTDSKDVRDESREDSTEDRHESDRVSGEGDREGDHRD